MIAYPDYLDWRAQNRVFEDVGVYRDVSWTVTVAAIRNVSTAPWFPPPCFPCWASRHAWARCFPGRGRPFRRPKPVVLLGYGYWQRRFGGDTNVTTQALNLNARSYAIVGVMPPGFRFPYEADIWVPWRG